MEGYSFFMISIRWAPPNEVKHAQRECHAQQMGINYQRFVATIAVNQRLNLSKQ